jgi:hypothetical protein
MGVRARRLHGALRVGGIGLAFALLGTGTVRGGGFCSRFIRGDTDLDGLVTAADALDTLNFLFAGGTAPACLSAADADDSGDLDLADPLFSFFYLYLQGPPPPEPGPLACGFDPTPDGLSCDSFALCGPQAEERDFTGFQSFHYAVHPALGFCLEVGEAYEASITAAGPGDYRLELSAVEEGEAGNPECLEGVFKFPCLVAVPQEPRQFTAEEVERLRQAFLSVTVFHGSEPICHCVVIDPCRIEAFSWDGASLSSFPCNDLRLDPGDAASLKAFLAALGGHR